MQDICSYILHSLTTFLSVTTFQHISYFSDLGNYQYFDFNVLPWLEELYVRNSTFEWKQKPSIRTTEKKTNIEKVWIV